jgi:hypothetical protein
MNLENNMATTTQDQLPMTEAEYSGVGGNCCPFCRSENITGGSVEINNGGAYQTVGCDDCDKEWTDTYALTGYEET